MLIARPGREGQATATLPPGESEQKEEGVVSDALA